jgi:Flp pilus assembly CpaE family ATPase
MSLDHPVAPGGQLQVVLGVSRSPVLPLRVAYQGHELVRVVAACTTAGEVLAAIEREQADAAVVDEDLHGLDRTRLSALRDRRVRLVLLSRQPDSARWEGLDAVVLDPDTDPLDILRTLQRTSSPSPRRSRPARSVTNRPAAPNTTLSGQSRAKQPTGSINSKSQVVALWSARGSAGKTTLGLNALALSGAAERTVLVELESAAASLAAYLDDGRDGHLRRARSTLLELAGARLRTPTEWDQALDQTLQQLGDYSPHARLLCGIAHPEQRYKLTDPAALVEELVAALRRHFTRVLLDVGSDPLGGESIEAQAASTALRLADRVLVVATPEPASVHRTCMALVEAGDRLDRRGISLVVNRVDPKVHGDVSWISNAVGLPISAVLPADDRAQRRAVVAAVPVVRDPDSRLRRPLARLLKDLGSGPSVDAFVPAPRPQRHVFSRPIWNPLRAALGLVPTSIGGSR